MQQLRSLFFRARKSLSLKKLPFEQKVICLLLLTAPFDRIPSVDVFDITLRPSFVFGSISVLWLANEFINKRYVLNLFSKTMIAFALWTLISIAWSVNLGRGLRYGVFTVFMAGIAVSVSAIFQLKYLGLYIRYILLATILVCVFGLYQYFGNYLGLPDAITGMRSLQYGWQAFGFPRMHSTFLEPLYLSAYLLLPANILVNQLIFGKGYIRKSFALPILCLVVFCDMLTLSRGGILALVMSVCFQVAIYIFIKKRISISASLKGLAVGALIVVAAITLIGLIGRSGSDSELTGNKKGVGAFLNQFSILRLTPNEEDILQQNSVYERAQTREKALDIIRTDASALWFGIGPAQYGPYIQNNQELFGWPVVNNLYVEQLVEAGIIGASFLIGLVCIAVYSVLFAVRKKEYIALAIVAYFLGIGLQYLTFSALHVMHIWVSFGLLAGFKYHRVSKL